MSEQFKLTEAHIKLLSNANVGWNNIEWGAPGIDGKRPFGNGDVYADMANILGFPESGDEDEPYPESLRDYLDTIYKQLETALGIVLAAQTFEPGTYEADDYSRNWKKL